MLAALHRGVRMRQVGDYCGNRTVDAFWRRAMGSCLFHLMRVSIAWFAVGVSVPALGREMRKHLFQEGNV